MIGLGPFLRAFLIICASVTTTVAQEKIVLKMGTLGSTEYVYYKGAKRMADYVAETSGGRVEIQVFANQQLGNDRDMIEGMQLGTVDLGVINTPLLAGFDPRFLLFDMPFLFKDWPHVSKVLDGPDGKALLTALEPKSLKTFAFANNGFRHVLNYKRAIRTPADLIGLKIRTLDNPVHVAIMNAMGGNATPMQYSEVATALRQHTVDGIDFITPGVITEKLYETNKYMSLTGHVFTGAAYMMSLPRFKSLPPDLQAIVEEGARIGAAHETDLYLKAEDEALQVLTRDHGMVINTVDRAPFQAKVQTVYDRFQDRVGRALIETVRKAGQ